MKTIFTGQTMELRTRDFVQTYIYMFGCWEPDVSHLILSRLRPGDVALDIGSHVGYDALLMAHAVGVRGKVFAFEPDPTSFNALRRNVALNDLATVQLVNAGVFEESGQAELVEVIPGNSGSRSIAIGVEGKRVGKVKLVRIEEVVAPQDLARVKLIKIDTEGVEGAVLDNLLASPALSQARPDIIVELSAFEDLERRDTWNRLAKLGYRPFLVPNDYSREAYAEWRAPAELKPLTAMPTRMTDVLFSLR